jgi:hypothetical protein
MKKNETMTSKNRLDATFVSDTRKKYHISIPYSAGH